MNRIVTAAWMLSACTAVQAALTVPAIIGDNMVLQRSRHTAVWGRADAGERVTVEVTSPAHDYKATATATADASGRWRTDIDLSQASESAVDLDIRSRERLTFHNVLIGEVWLCAGQSNMEWSVEKSTDAKKEIAAATDPAIRLFSVAKRPAAGPGMAVEGRWVVGSPETVPHFSAAGYFFARELRRARPVSVGLINDNWGNTPAEAWTSLATLKSRDLYSKLLATRDAALDPAKASAAKAEYERTFVEWAEKNGYQDAADEGQSKGFAQPGFDDSAWKTMTLPQPWQTAGENYNGAVWFRRSLNVPPTFAADTAVLHLGTIDDFDTAYLNGKQIGQTTAAQHLPQPYTLARDYKVPAGVLRPGRNVVAVRVFDRIGRGGLTGPAGTMKLSSGPNTVDLSGDWKYCVERALPLKAATGEPQPSYGLSRTTPAALYDAMIEPLFPNTLAGVLWYQGENNAARGAQYRTLLKDMIRDWRKGFGPDLPFLIVQLSSSQPKRTKPIEDLWGEIRDAQREVAANDPKAGLVVTFDLGEVESVHFKNKQDVGKRLALLARKLVYGESNLVASGPVMKSSSISGDQVRLSFDSVGGGLMAVGGKLSGFAICGADRKWVWGNARIDGNDVIVTSPAVPNSVAVRYAWAINCEATLANQEGLPAGPFRTDDFPWLSDQRK